MNKLFRLLLIMAGSLMLAGVGYAYNCANVAQYVDGNAYSAGAVVQNNGEAYQCTIGGWCTVGGPYAPGAGWAWTNAWSDLGACDGGGNPPPSSGNPPPSSGNPPPSSGNPPPSSGNPPPSSGNPPPSSGTGSCSSVDAWNASTAYNGGAQVSYDGNIYSAKWWTQGANPAQNSGQWDVWKLVGACTGGNPPPSSGNPPPSSGNPPPSSGNPPPSSGGGGHPAPGFILAPYVDITTDINWQNSQLRSLTSPPAGLSAETWSFATGNCNSENWAGLAKEEMAKNVPLAESAGIDYIVGMGGAAGTFNCSSGQNLISMIQRYYGPNMLGVDFDVEHAHNAAWANGLVSAVQAAQAQYPNLEFSFTLATFGSLTRSGSQFNSDGQVVIDALQSAGMLDSVYINLMTMYYGAPSANVCVVVGGTCDMGKSAIAAATKLHQDWGVPYSHIQVTPYLGGTASGQFSLQDMDEVAAFAKQEGLSAVKWWALNIDPGFQYLNRANADGL